ncbi:hypothetical protein GJ744_005225 [Endocarpon pusillum]|uniref:Peptidase A1 domain-containing protein n=1 Tax=Endocarpon pusillum TaxID=364733 RepID=A0A8H7A8Q8_9EURO|nr:hypothetical protein GJ744_005225 [Endocarpon pusillum]
MFPTHLVAGFVTALCLQLQKVLGAENSSSVAPLSFAPSGYWDGIDGSWSTFVVELGTPPQPVRLLPSITGQAIWAVMPQACHNSSSYNICSSDRGGIFATNQSSTWEQKGMFVLPLNPQNYLPFYGDAMLGFETVTPKLDGPHYEVRTLDHQVVANYAAEDFYIGALGLSPLSINITSVNDSHPSLLGTLRAENHISSTSYGYTAGANYSEWPLNNGGSLTFGGYDSARMDVTRNLTIVGGADTYRPMLVGIENIKSGSSELLDGPIVAGLDSLVSQIWLPASACRHFESAFGLVWNSTHQLYIVNETQHSTLLAQNPAITFTLSTGSAQNKDERLDITFPYAAFDLTAKPPFAGLNETAYYFPLKPATDEVQYTLGRTFLQEAYMIADYDRASFSLFPAVFPQYGTSKLISIVPPEDISHATATENGLKNGLSQAAIGGIVIATVIFILLVVATIVFRICHGRRQKTGKVASGVSNVWEKPELANDRTYDQSELEARMIREPRHELPTSANTTELQGSDFRPPLQEMSADPNSSGLCPPQPIREPL